MSDDENYIIKARFQNIPPEVLARVKELSETDNLATDPAAIAEDLQTVAGLAIRNAENIEVLIQVIERIAAAGTLKVDKPAEKPPKGSDRFST